MRRERRTSCTTEGERRPQSGQEDAPIGRILGEGDFLAQREGFWLATRLYALFFCPTECGPRQRVGGVGRQSAGAQEREDLYRRGGGAGWARGGRPRPELRQLPSLRD